MLFRSDKALPRWVLRPAPADTARATASAPAMVWPSATSLPRARAARMNASASTVSGASVVEVHVNEPHGVLADVASKRVREPRIHQHERSLLRSEDNLMRRHRDLGVVFVRQACHHFAGPGIVDHDFAAGLWDVDDYVCG